MTLDDRFKALRFREMAMQRLVDHLYECEVCQPGDPCSRYRDLRLNAEQPREGNSLDDLAALFTWRDEEPRPEECPGLWLYQMPPGTPQRASGRAMVFFVSPIPLQGLHAVIPGRTDEAIPLEALRGGRWCAIQTPMEPVLKIEIVRG